MTTMGKQVTLITGAARSGTSMTAGIIDICGAFGGNTAGPTPNNKKGMFENVRVRNDYIKPYLSAMGFDPMGQNPLPEISKLQPFLSLCKKIEDIFIEDGYKDGPWYYKGAKMCLIWPVFKNAFPDAKWIIVRRDDSGIVNSCLRTGFMKKHDTAAGWQSWVDVHKQRFIEMQTSGLKVREVWPSKFIANDYTEIKEVIEWLGLEWKDEEIKQFVDPKLYTAGEK